VHSNKLLVACENGAFASAEVAIDAGADVNYFSGSKKLRCLMPAAREGHRGIAALLLWKGADVDKQAPDGETALYFAAQDGNEKCVELFLVARANKEAARFTYTPLMVAAMNGREKCVQMLITDGADLEVETDSGLRAVQMAIIETRIDCLRTLVRGGAKVCQTDFEALKNLQGIDVSEFEAALRLPVTPVSTTTDSRRRY
jgi:ankyrin repeat protein